MKWGASFRWSFGPNSAWGSLETTTNRHPTLPSEIDFFGATCSWIRGLPLNDNYPIINFFCLREMEISMQLGSETASRGQSEELYEKQRAKENRLKDQLEKLKKQVSDLENKWEMADIQHQQTVGISEERKSKNQQSEWFILRINYVIMYFVTGPFDGTSKSATIS